MNFFKQRLMNEANGTEGGQTPGTSKEKITMEQSNEMSTLRQALEKLQAQFSKMAPQASGNETDGDLVEKAKAAAALANKNHGDQKALEAALNFSLRSEQWLKENQSALPKTVADIFKAADSEKYGSAIEKDRAIKAGIVKEFFSVQTNMDLLTPGQKNQLEEYLKLTKNGREEQAQNIYDSIFEPALKYYRGMKKQEALGKGYGDSSDDAYKNKLADLGRKLYLGDKV